MSPEAKEIEFIADKLWVWPATLFGVGYFPKMPGTAASLVTVPIAYALAGAGFWIYLSVSVILTFLSIPICGRAAKVLGQGDPSCVVLDECAGMLIALSPCAYFHPGGYLNGMACLAGFLLFRYFDIKKPLFVNKIQDLDGGLGIVLDDVGAGLLAALAGSACYAAAIQISALI